MGQEAGLRRAKVRSQAAIGFLYERLHVDGGPQGSGELTLVERRRGFLQPGAGKLPAEGGDQCGRPAVVRLPEDLPRLERRERGDQALGAGTVGPAVHPLSCRDVDHGVGTRAGRTEDGDREEAVVRPAQDPVLHDGPGSDDSRHLPPDETLREPGVLDLVAQRDLVPFANEPAEVGLHRVVGNTRHRGPHPLGVGAPGREHHIQLPCEELRVVPERLVEVPDAEQHEVAGVAGLHALGTGREAEWSRPGIRHRERAVER